MMPIMNGRQEVSYMYFFSLTLPLLLFAAENRTARRCFLIFHAFPQKAL